MRKIKRLVGYFILVLMLMCSTRVFASEIVPLDFYGVSDNSSAFLKYTIKTSDGGFAGLASVGPKEYGLNYTQTYGVPVVAKLNANMEVEWVYSLKGSYYSFTDIVEDNNKNLILVGRSEYPHPKLLGYDISKTAILVINSKGEKVKETELSVRGFENLLLDSLAFDGEFFYSIGSHKKTTIVREDNDYYYVRDDIDCGWYKYNSDFELIFFEKIDSLSYELQLSKHIGGTVSTGITRSSFIDFTPDGNIVFAYNHNDNMNATVFKYDKLGNFIFKTEVGGKKFSSKYASDEVLSLVATKDNGVVAVGRIASFDENERQGYSDAFYFKLDKDGKVVWEKYIIGPDGDSISGIGRYNDNYALVGDTSANIENTDITGKFMMIINDSGETLATRSIKDDLDYSYNEPLIVDDSKIYLSGYANKDYSHYSNITKYTNAIVTYSFEYNINVIEKNEVKISVDKSAVAGEIVKFTIDLKDGYEFKGLDGIKLTTIDKKTYSFVMPAADIDLKPIIEKVDDNIVNPNTSDFVVVICLSVILIIIGINVYSYRKNSWLK